ncbi:camp-regulated phosphoprotein family protein Igo1 [Penicillium lividum]|nr:camp-regulated phosphoprotein family protein Igo1 [Penicillium lividum]
MDVNAKAARRYGIIPLRDKLFSEESKQRTYFDSADFALKSDHRPSEIYNNDIGTKHPEHAHISHPFCAVPGSSNLSQHANDGFRTGSDYQQCDSLLHEDGAKESERMIN